MTAPARYDMSIFRGTDYKFKFRAKDANGGDLSVDQIRWFIAVNNEVIITKTLHDGDFTTEVSVDGNTYECTLNENETRSIPRGSVASYEVEIRADGLRQVPLAGEITALGGLNSD